MFRLLKDRALSLRLKSKLILSFLLSSICILLLFAFILYRYTADTFLKQSERSALSSISQLETNLTTVLDTIDSVGKNILVSSFFSKELKLDQISSPADVQLINGVYDFFSEQMIGHPYIHSIVYYGDNGVIIGSSASKNIFQYDPEKSSLFYQSEFLKDLKKSSGPVLRGNLRYSDFFPGAHADFPDPLYISFGQRLSTMNHTAGFVVVNVKESYIRSLYHDDSRNLFGESLLLDSRSRILSCEDKTLIGTTVLIKTLDTQNTVSLTLALGDNQKLNDNNQIIYYPYEKYGLSMIYEIPYQTLFEPVHKLKTLLTLLLVLFIVLSLGVCFFWINAVTKPLNSLILAMKAIGKGNLGITMPVSGSSDFRFLTEQFNKMSQNIQNLLHENEVLQEERHKLALQNLQAQLNPHFLYNTLNTIKWMAILSKTDNIARCATALGNLLQPIFQTTATTWSLAEELDYLKNYLCIMNYRTGGFIEFSVHAEPSIRSCQVPKFILQPLVENAVTHFNPSPEVKSAIWLTGSVSDNTVTLLLQDNGLGISPQKLEQLRTLLSSDQDFTRPLDRSSLPAGIGIGILNTNRRLRLQYGNSCGLTVDSTENGGTVITILFMLSPDIP